MKVYGPDAIAVGLALGALASISASGCLGFFHGQKRETERPTVAGDPASDVTGRSRHLMGSGPAT
jgi:hypothetical protein